MPLGRRRQGQRGLAPACLQRRVPIFGQTPLRRTSWRVRLQADRAHRLDPKELQWMLQCAAPRYCGVC